MSTALIAVLGSPAIKSFFQTSAENFEAELHTQKDLTIAPAYSMLHAAYKDLSVQDVSVYSDPWLGNPM